MKFATLETMPATTRTALTVGVVAVVAAAAVVALAWMRQPVPISAPIRTGSSVSSFPSSLASWGSSPAASVTVDVEGRVHRPGLVSLPSGSRVADAIRAAGGATAGTDLSGLNLARKIVDGEQIVVGANPLSAGSNSTAATSGPINLNLATLADLDGLPGVGPVTAQRILDWRTSHGPFVSVEQLREVEGIGAKTFDRLKPLVTV